MRDYVAGCARMFRCWQLVNDIRVGVERVIGTCGRRRLSLVADGGSPELAISCQSEN